MKNQHTPGPWALLDREENSRTLTHITNGAHIVCTLGTTRTDGSPNHSANAHLIAAAPDLLDALEQAYNAIAWDIPSGSFSDQEEEDLLETIRAAISKAEGAK
jgi:hypothetical protein